MLSIRYCRPLIKQLIRYSLPNGLLLPRLQDSCANLVIRGSYSTAASRQPLIRRDRIQQDYNNVTEPRPKDSPEVTAHKNRIINEVHNPRIDLDAVVGISASYNALVEAETIFSRALTRQLLDWCCRASLFANGLIATNQSLLKDPEFQQKKKEPLRVVIDDIVARYKQGRFQTDGDITATILFHYQNTDQIDKALAFWSWLERVRERGHLNYRGYAARIVIAERLDEGADECENLYQEAVDKFGDPLVNYHLSKNAILLDKDRPVGKEVAEVIPLLKSMFSVRLRSGDWRNAYLTLDTILRLDPRALWERAKFEVLSMQSPWESYLVDRADANLKSRKDSKQPVVTQWVDQLIPESMKVAEGKDITPSRVHSVACTILASLYRGYRTENVVDRHDEEVSGPKLDHLELVVLWKCWAKLYYWHGKDETIDHMRGTGAFAMINFIKMIIRRGNYQTTGRLQKRMKNNFKLSQKQDGVPELKEVSTTLLADLHQRIGAFQAAAGEEKGPDILENIPNWSGLLNRNDMLGLYQEVDQRTSADDQPTEEVPDESQELQSSSEPADDPPQLIYETRAGLQFGEARFRHWMMINNVFLVTDEFERNGCLQWQFTPDDPRIGIAQKQASLLEELNGVGLSSEEKEIKKQVLLERLRVFRRYVGDSNVDLL